MTGDRPFHYYPNKHALPIRVIGGTRPNWNKYRLAEPFSADFLKIIVQRCWDGDPAKRPDIEHLSYILPNAPEYCRERSSNYPRSPEYRTSQWVQTQFVRHLFIVSVILMYRALIRLRIGYSLQTVHISPILIHWFSHPTRAASITCYATPIQLKSPVERLFRKYDRGQESQLRLPT